MRKGSKHKKSSTKKITGSLKKYYKTHDNPRKGKSVSRATRLKLSIAGYKRKPASKKTRLKISKANTGSNHPMFGLKGKLSPNFGQRRTKKQRKRLSISHLGNKNSLGRVCSIETRIKISNGNKDKKRTKKQKEQARIRIANNPIPRKNTLIEIKIQNELEYRNIKFNKHVPLIGQPDIFIEPNICIFADGNLYHANPKKYKPNTIVPKINMKAKDKWKYDKSVTRRLKYKGYIVLRFWETNIHNNIKQIGNKIEKIVKERI
jgi:G:T-mismatch repair DNA endonuclease (very short patch repair protein)